MTGYTVHTGASKEYSDNFADVFGDDDKKPTRQKAAKKASSKPSKAKKKAAKKKSAKKKTRRKKS